VDNIEIAAILEELADLLEIKGSNPFRIRAYRNAVRTIGGLTFPLSSMVAKEEDLTDLPAVGKDISSHIVELVRTGRLGRLEEVAGEVPRSLGQLVKLDGVGPKKAKKLWESLGVTTVDELEMALVGGRVEDLEGFGATSAAKIVRAIQDFRRYSDRFLISQVDGLIRAFLEYMREAPTVQRIEVAGSYRRRQETIGDVDILAQAELPARDIMERFTTFNAVERIVSAGETRGSVVLRSGLEVDLRIIPEVSFGAALHYFTGSKEHNVALRHLARRKGLRVNEYGVFRIPKGADPTEATNDIGKRIAGKTEESVFEAVGVTWISPLLRENRGELDVAREGSVPDLLTLDDIQADLHMHSTWSDGKFSIEDMARACQARGYGYLAISDHSPALA
ncbi:uncharacterized protein METZ01_LOCUS186169, partial [marine metagenome]